LLAAAGIGVVMAVLVVVLVVADPATERRSESPLVGKPAPELAGAQVDDTRPSYDLAATDGRFTLVNFFATWCFPCKVEHPELVRFAEEYDGAVDVVSVAMDGAEPARAFFDERGGDWPVVDDDDGAISIRWGVLAPPESFLVAPDGTVLSKITGGVTFGGLENLLARVTGG
jgi:cytochrome c biogenesis protein CcmG/thiol:disulfide interchange protein DsbE